MSVAAGINDSTTINRNAGLPGSGSAAGNRAADLHDRFLTLLVSQLKNQDPTHPLDNSQLTTQLAQINTLSGIEKLNTTLGSISGQINAAQTLQASALINHGVMVNGKQILVGKNGKDNAVTPFGLEIQQDSTNTTATITDANGKVMRTIDLGTLRAGVHVFAWDGTDAKGNKVAAGKYSVAITASNSSGQLNVQPLNYAQVNGVIRDKRGVILDLGIYGTVTLDQVRQIL